MGLGPGWWYTYVGLGEGGCKGCLGVLGEGVLLWGWHHAATAERHGRGEDVGLGLGEGGRDAKSAERELSRLLTDKVK